MHSLPAFFLQAQAPAASPANPMVFFIQIAVIFAIFYFIVMRPQRKQQKLLEQALMNMSKGDKISTAGGIVGEVVHIGANPNRTMDASATAGPSMADHITIKSGESKLVVERGRITRVEKAG
jgi:preprotein translocase subunit YajC